ncbi:MAG: Ornithine cyclodeaminase [Candidatus Saccharicenans subterraneus]|uniref:Ornithine cyclodeaminase n=1 Tax=Candidatus Saccharicenans subterraneus TaxID=2508984 RepID=A0A3E2BKJ2_9BACT|nr:MAG: Ornithine cyclodeaminase [Candidatus Saccharicenans subterraneum]
MLLLSRDDLKNLLSMREAIDLVEKGFLWLHQKKVLMPPRSVITTPFHGGSLLMMPVLIEDRKKFLVTKVITVYPYNQQLFGYPALQGINIIFDAENGTPEAILDAHFLTALRTGAAGGVALRYLARKEADTVALFGAGPQARTQLEAACAVLPVKKCYLVSYGDPREKDFALEMGTRLGIEVLITVDVESAVSRADVVITATNSREPVFKGEWLRPGTHVTAIGSFQPEVRELDSETIRRSRVFVDNLEAAREEAGDIIIPVKEGVITWDKVEAELGEVIAGEKPGRLNVDEVTIFKSVGLAVQDAVVAVGAYLKAVESKVGMNFLLGGEQ